MFVISIWKVAINPIFMIIIFLNSLTIFLFCFFIKIKNLDVSFWFIKDYFIVLAFSIFPMIFYQKTISFKEQFKIKKKELLSLTIIPFFINSTYTFWFPIEIILVPILAFVSYSVIFMEQSDYPEATKKLLKNVQLAVNLYIILWSLSLFVSNFNDVFEFDFWLSFSIEYLVLLVNLPILCVSRELIYIEKKVLNSDYKNRLFYYFKYYFEKLKYRYKSREYLFSSLSVKEYVLRAEERYRAGKVVSITLNKIEIADEILISIIVDAVFGRNRYTNITNRKGKYPNMVEIKDKNNKLYAIWQDNFLSEKFRGKYFDTVDKKEIYEDIWLV